MYFLEENVHGFENASAGRLLPECNCGKNTEGDCYQILREEEEETHWPKPLNKRKGSNRGKRWVGVGVEDQRRSEIEEMYYSSDKRKQLLLNSQLYHSSCFDTLGIGRRWAGLRDAGEELEESEEMEESEESEEMEEFEESEEESEVLEPWRSRRSRRLGGVGGGGGGCGDDGGGRGRVAICSLSSLFRSIVGFFCSTTGASQLWFFDENNSWCFFGITFDDF